MNLRIVTLIILLGGIAAATQLAAQDAKPGDDVIELGAQPGALDIAATSLTPNRRGLFEGVNLTTQGIVIGGREYAGGAHQVPLIIGNELRPVYTLSANTPVRFHVDADGFVRAVWLDGELQE